MKSEKEWQEFFREDERKLNVNSREFFARHMEIMRLIEAAKNNSKKTQRGNVYVCRIPRCG